ncbi:hypothetical protein Tco_1034733, partial [Tanacetum coccineum]
MSKKQNCTAMSSAEAEYVALSASCAQVMWMRTQLQDYGFNYNKILLYCDSQSAIAISCNPVQAPPYQHIHPYGPSQERFQYLVRRIGMRCLTPAELESPTHYPCDSARTFRVILFSIHNDEWKSFQCHHQTALRRPYALSWKPCQGDSLNLPDHRIHKDGDGDASFQLKSDSLPHAHAQTTKTFYKHQDSRIMKAQELKTKTSAQTLIYKIFLQRYQVYQGRLLASFQDDAKYEHTKSKDNDKGSRSKITKHEGTSLQRRQRQRSQELNDKSNLIDLTKECHNELTSEEIVSLKILSRTMEVHEEEVSSDENEMMEVKVLMALAEDNHAVSKEGARNGEWVKISIRKKRVLGVDQLTEDPSSFGKKDLVFVKSLADDTKVSIPGVQRPLLSKVEDFIMLNHDTSRIIPVESQRNTSDPSIAVTDSSTTKYDSVDESLVYGTPLTPLKKLNGAEPTSRPNT